MIVLILPGKTGFTVKWFNTAISISEIFFICPAGVHVKKAMGENQKGLPKEI